jgi:hypothetical protein
VAQSLVFCVIVGRLLVGFVWYREYHCPVTDKNLHYTENATVLLLTNKKSLKIPKGNQNPHIEEEQTTQRPKEKVQKEKQQVWSFVGYYLSFYSFCHCIVCSIDIS